MTGRNSGRSRKSINSSKFSSNGNNSDDDDDFADPTPPRRKKTKRLDRSKESNDKTTMEKPQERKSRNRLSAEDKYQQELEVALKMSLVNKSSDSTSEKPLSLDVEASTMDSKADFIKPPAAEEPIPSIPSRTVEADVMSSPNTKLLMNSKTNANIEKRKQLIINEAALSTEDKIISDPIKNNKETGRRKSDRSKTINKKEEDEYEMSDESESEDEIPSDSVSESSDGSDYKETPKKIEKPKKQNISAKKTKFAEKANTCSKHLVSTAKNNTTKPSSSLAKTSFHNKENEESLSKPGTPAASTNTASMSRKPTGSTLCSNTQQRTPSKTAPQMCSNTPTPRTPKTSSNLLIKQSPLISIRSPVALNKPARFKQPGWTPPGPSGSKSNILTSPKSPNIIRRVGLSRNMKLPSLHPNVGIK